MKRLVLCALAILLTSGALVGSRPAHACVVNPDCDSCESLCLRSGSEGFFCNKCTGVCHCF
jgi:hypothetical protein